MDRCRLDLVCPPLLATHPSRMNITKSLVLITGASSGIGAATAATMARKGARTILLARTRAGLKATATEVRKLGREAWVYPVDLTDSAAVAQTANAILPEVGA